MSNMIYGCGLPGCLVCNPRNLPRWGNAADIMRRTLDSMSGWRERELDRLRRRYPQKSEAQRFVEEIKSAKGER